MSEWISVKTKLPPKKEPVLVWIDYPTGPYAAVSYRGEMPHSEVFGMAVRDIMVKDARKRRLDDAACERLMEMSLYCLGDTDEFEAGPLVTHWMPLPKAPEES